MATEYLKELNQLIETFEKEIDYDAVWLSNCLKGLYSSDDKSECIKCIRLYTTAPDDNTIIGEIQKLINIPNALPNILKFIKQNNNRFELLCSGYFRVLQIKSILSIDIINNIHTFCIVDCIETLQDEGAWILTNISSGSSKQTKCVVDHGGIEILTESFNKSSSSQVKSCTLWALGNIAGDCIEFRDLVLTQNILHYISRCIEHIDIHQLNKYNISLSQNIAYLVSNCCRGIPKPPWKYIEIAVQIFAIMINANDKDILHHIVWSLNYLCENDDNDDNQSMKRIQLMIDNNVLKHLPRMLQHSSGYVRHGALKALDNIIRKGNNEQIYCVIDSGILKSFNSLISNDAISIKREACLVISHIAISNAQYIIDYNLVQTLVECLCNEGVEVSQEAMRSVLNAVTDVTNDHITYYVNNQIITAIFRFMNNLIMHIEYNGKYQFLLLIALEAMEKILIHGESTVDGGSNLYAQYVEECGGLIILQSFGRNDKIIADIQEKIENIVNTLQK